jgi:heme/copper-type cytochrome/quinol oxidase subunit 2
MADRNDTSNVAIVAIVIIVLVALGLLVYFLGFRSDKGSNQTTIQKPEFNIEKPVDNGTKKRP